MNRFKINGHWFSPREDCNYRYDYCKIVERIRNKEIDERGVLRRLVKEDTFFFAYFVWGVESSNHPFVVQYARDIDEGPDDMILDECARGHYKTLLRTRTGMVRDVLRNREERVGIFSHTKPAGKAILNTGKVLFEESKFLKWLFPDVLYENPWKETKWSLDDGLCLKREGFYQEASIEASGLIEGMNTGKHYTRRYYDDIETEEHVNSPETCAKLKDRFDSSQNLKDAGGKHVVVGTPYSHMGVVERVRQSGIYTVRLKPATHDGTWTGKPVLVSQEELDFLKRNEYSFNCQQLLNPTPPDVAALRGEDILVVKRDEVPGGLLKFMVIDPAGVGDDSWAVWVCAVRPPDKKEELGLSEVYILDGAIEDWSEAEAPEEIARIYLRNGIIQCMGIEKAALSTAEIHVANALARHGRRVSEDGRTLRVLKPAGRKKAKRIESALAWPLANGKIHVVDSVNEKYVQRLRDEGDRFPYWRDDGLDALSYLYDMIFEYRFGWFDSVDDGEDLEELEDRRVSGRLTGTYGRNAMTGY